MTIEIDYPEIKEVSLLLQDLLVDLPKDGGFEPQGLLWSAISSINTPASSPDPLFITTSRHEEIPLIDVVTSDESAEETAMPSLEELDDDIPTAERLAAMLEILCKRGKFGSAIIADSQGLPLADYNSPVTTEVLAAFALTLGEAIGKAGHFLGQHEANNISLDINFADKAVVRQFIMDGIPYYLLVICPQEADERGEIELSIEQIKATLT